jgi:hypothetical protein
MLKRWLHAKNADYTLKTLITRLPTADYIALSYVLIFGLVSTKAILYSELTFKRWLHAKFLDYTFANRWLHCVGKAFDQNGPKMELV